MIIIPNCLKKFFFKIPFHKKVIVDMYAGDAQTLAKIFCRKRKSFCSMSNNDKQNTWNFSHKKNFFSANCSSGPVEWMLIWQPRRKLPKRKGKQFCSFFENGKNFLKKIHSLKLSSWSQRMEFCQPCGKWFSRSLIFIHSTSEKHRNFFSRKKYFGC